MFALLLLVQAATVVAPPVVPVMPEKKVCRVTEAPTGSIMPARRVCKLRSEWAAIDAANQRQVDAVRNQREARPTS